MQHDLYFPQFLKFALTLSLAYHMCPEGAWSETCEEYWKAGC